MIYYKISERKTRKFGTVAELLENSVCIALAALRSSQLDNAIAHQYHHKQIQ